MKLLISRRLASGCFRHCCAAKIDRSCNRSKWGTYIIKGLEKSIVRYFIVYSVFGDRIVRYIFHIRIPEVKRGVKQCCSYTSNAGMFVTLNFMKLVE